MSLFTPINQKRLTNVSVVRCKKNGNRYELACYPNKVKAWREKLEKNIDEVLQAHEVFSNVSKGQLATKSDVLRDFDTDDIESVILTILNDGEMQVSGKERKVANESLFRDVAKIVSEKCINTETHHAYTVTMIEKMMRDCHISLQSKKSAKQQALEVIKQLRSIECFKIAPAMMELLISLDPKLVDITSPHILKLVHCIIKQERSPEGIFELSAVVETDKYHALSEALQEHAKDRFCIEIIGPVHNTAANRFPKKHVNPVVPCNFLGLAGESIPEMREGPSPELLPAQKQPPDQIAADSEDQDEYAVSAKNAQQRNKNKKRRNRKKTAGGDFEKDDN